MRRGLNLPGEESLFRPISPDVFAQTARVNNLLPRRETSRQLAKERERRSSLSSSLFVGFNRFDCFANVKSSEAARQTLRLPGTLLNDVIMIIIIISLGKMSVRRQSLTLMRHRAELTSACPLLEICSRSDSARRYSGLAS